MAVLSAAGLILIAQLTRWQVVQHGTFVDLAKRQNEREIVLKPTRGNIYDANHHLLAVDTIQYEVSASPQLISNPRETSDRVYRLLNIPRETLLDSFEGEALWVPLSRNASREVGETLLGWEITGISASPRSKRAYPENALGAHLLGFVNDNSQGYYGVEGYYDNLLQGLAGRQRGEHGPFGDIIPLGDFEITLPTEGADLYLTLDRSIQQMAEEELAAAVEEYGAEGGSVIIYNPKTGALMASANLPNYDPNNFAESDIENFLDPLKPSTPRSWGCG
jgi:cell division protein FtsI/penicillin-binding protein 2